MKISTPPADKFVISVSILIPSSEHHKQLDGALEWDFEKLEEARKGPQKVLLRLTEYWTALVKPYVEHFSFEVRECSHDEKLFYKICVWHKPAHSQNSNPDTTKRYAQIIKDGTSETVRLLREYTAAVELTGTDVPIVCQDSQLENHDKVVSGSSLAVSTVQQWLFSDAKNASSRPEIRAIFGEDEMIIPRALDKYPTQIASESITFVGYINSTNDAQHTAELRIQPHRKGHTLSFSPAQRDSILEMQLRRVSVIASVRKVFHKIAGASAFDSYELLSCTPIDPV